MDNLLALLSSLSIPFTRYDHTAVFTCEESEDLETPIPGAHTKQLLMKGKRTGKIVLAIVMHDKRVDTKSLGKEYGEQSFSFASPELLFELLSVTPGSVTPFGLTSDRDHRIDVIVDEDAWRADALCFHPMVNTATLVINCEGFKAFLRHTGHTFTVRPIPVRSPTPDA